MAMQTILTTRLTNVSMLCGCTGKGGEDSLIMSNNIQIF